MSVQSNTNLLENQMKPFSQKEEEVNKSLTTPTPFTSTVDTKKPSSAGVLESAGVKSAKDILQAQGAPVTAKSILQSTYFEGPQGLNETRGTTAASIIEDYQKEEEKRRAAQKTAAQTNATFIRQELDFIEKEKDFIKNFKYEQPEYNPYAFEGTKFGDLNFKDAELVYSHGFRNTTTGKATYFTYGLNTKDGNYIFMPEEFALKGIAGENGTRYNTGFLNTKTWEAMFEVAQPIDAGALKDRTLIDPALAGQNPSTANWGRGFLFKEQDWNNFNLTYLAGKYYQEGTYSGNAQPLNKTSNLGIANIKGKLYYVKNNSVQGRTTYYDIKVDETGVTSWSWQKKKGGVLGSIARAFAEIPFAPEIAFIATGGTNPALYASLKALQTAGKGGKIEDVLKSGALAYVTASVAPKIGDYGKALGSTIAVNTGINAAVANTIGTAVVNAGFNGFVAAATGQDIKDAMLSGAISGGLGASADKITNTIFGGEKNVAALAKTLNLNTAQAQRIFTGAIANGAINSAVHGKDFLDSFTESLVVNGLSQSGANAVRSNLSKTMAADKREAVVRNTRIFIEASARAAVRGESIETAIKRVTPYVLSRAAGEAIAISTKKK